MDEKERNERMAVVAIAKTWIGTPYHGEARIRGVGADCATMVAEVYMEAGLIPRFDIEHYPQDWHLHKGEERYLSKALSYAREVEGPPLPGDVVLWRFGRCFSHGAIVVQWPQIIHAYVGRVCTYDDGEAPWLNTIGENCEAQGRPRPRKFLSYWG